MGSIKLEHKGFFKDTLNIVGRAPGLWRVDGLTERFLLSIYLPQATPYGNLPSGRVSLLCPVGLAKRWFRCLHVGQGSIFHCQVLILGPFLTPVGSDRSKHPPGAW